MATDAQRDTDDVDVASGRHDGPVSRSKPDEDGRSRWWSEGALSGIIALSAVFAAIAYGISYDLARHFYGVFQLTPREAGYTQQDAVFDAALYLFRWAYLAVLAAPVVYLAWRLLRRLRRSGWATYALQRRYGRALVGVALVVLAYWVALGLFWQPTLLQEAGTDLALRVYRRDPAPATEPPWYKPQLVPGVNVTFGEVRWAVPTLDGSKTVVHRTAATVFGGSDGMMSFFDHCSSASRRVPGQSFWMKAEVTVAGGGGFGGAGHLDDAELHLYCRWISENPTKDVPEHYPLHN